jgi:broad specificity phosphatase PhoE
MADLILIRHSQTRQVADVSSHQWILTDEGQARCKRLAEPLRPYALDRIITSEEPKAFRTGELVADILNIPCEKAPNLHEQRRSTAPYSPSVEVFQAQIQAAMNEPDKVLFGEETFNHARQRFSNQIDALLAQYPDQSLAIVTHGTVMSLYLAQISGEAVFPLWQSLDMPAYAVVSSAQKQITKIVTSVS